MIDIEEIAVTEEILEEAGESAQDEFAEKAVTMLAGTDKQASSKAGMKRPAAAVDVTEPKESTTELVKRGKASESASQKSSSGGKADIMKKPAGCGDKGKPGESKGLTADQVAAMQAEHEKQNAQLNQCVATSITMVLKKKMALKDAIHKLTGAQLQPMHKKLASQVVTEMQDFCPKLGELMAELEDVQTTQKGDEYTDLKIDKLNVAGDMINEADVLLKNFGFYHKLATGGNAKSETQAYSEKSG